ncbi:prohormone convertase 1 [Aphelenchoides avenae]|nr:prohormone convertase 1 [Aphelenchus avenae]
MTLLRLTCALSLVLCVLSLNRTTLNELEHVLNELIALEESLSPVVHYIDQGGKWSYDNEWVVRVPGGEKDAMLVANHTGTKYIGQVRGFPDLFLLRGTFAGNSMRRKKREVAEMGERIKRDNNVLWAEQQKIRVRAKRSGIPRRPTVTLNDPLWPKQWHMVRFST